MHRLLPLLLYITTAACLLFGLPALTARAAALPPDSLIHGEEAVTLQELVVGRKKERYSKKNNPAVELMRRVRRNRDMHNPAKNSEHYSYDRYDKMVIGLNDYRGYSDYEMIRQLGEMMDADKSGKSGKSGKKSKDSRQKREIITSLVDTAVWTGKRILDLSLKEKLSTRIFSGRGAASKEIVRAQKSDGIDRKFDKDFTRVFFEQILRDVDIYDQEITVLQTKFVSPLSALGADFYKYHIEDTVLIGTDRCVELSFSPRNPESAGFNGRLYIPADDSVKYVRRALLRIPKAANVNYVSDFYLSQNYIRDAEGNTHKTLDDLVLELSIIPKTQGLYLARQTRYDNFSYHRRRDLGRFYSKIGDTFDLEESDGRDGPYWDTHRMLPLSFAEGKLSGSGSPYSHIRLVWWLEKATEILVTGYVKTGRDSKFDIGPIDTFFTYNSTEGVRLNLGGMTTANLSRRFFARGYVGYGFRDGKPKYSGEVEYSFVDKRYHSREFPVNSLRASYTYDIYKIGENGIFGNRDNILTSIRRVHSRLDTYRRLATLEYNIEWRNNLSLHASVNAIRQEDSPYVKFIDGFGNSVGHYNENYLRLALSWQPGRKLTQTQRGRYEMNPDKTVVQISHEIGPKGLLGSDYTMNLTEIMLRRRQSLSMFGTIDAMLLGGKLWSQVQFPELLWQNANVSYTMRKGSYALLNPMEFAMDEYLSLDFTWYLNGLIFNRIPLVKKARLREVFTFKGFMGHLSRRNNPEYNENLYRFPDAATQPMGKTPYMEIGVGIDNILTFIRLDYIWRLSYRDTPGAPNSGLRVSFHFSF